MSGWIVLALVAVGWLLLVIGIARVLWPPKTRRLRYPGDHDDG